MTCSQIEYLFEGKGPRAITHMEFGSAPLRNETFMPNM